MNEQYAELAELAGGFIHEIKNHLSTLGLNLQLLAEDFQDPQSQRERRASDRVQRLQNECQRLVDVSNDFLRFARIKDLELDARPAWLASSRRWSISSAPRPGRPTSKSSCYLPADLPAVPLDRDLFKQALLNLMLNAEQAMPGGGELTIQASYDPTCDPEHICLSLIDTGKGMTPEVAAKVFRPFFSTKPGGTGLGLPTTRKIVAGHGGPHRSAERGRTRERSSRSRCRSLKQHADASLRGTNRMDPLANVNGEQMPLAEVKISALDRGFLFGDAVYEVLRVYQGKPWLADEHFRRLARSLEAIRIRGIDVERLRRRMLDTIAAGSFREAIVYIQITRGAAPRSAHLPAERDAAWNCSTSRSFTTPTRKPARTEPRSSPSPTSAGTAATSSPPTCSPTCWPCRPPRKRAGQEALLYLPDGTLTEGTHTSFFGVLHGTLLTAPNSNAILPGITRGLVLRLAERAGIAVREHVLKRSDLADVSELFLTGTTSEVLPIVRVDGKPLGDGNPGPITQRLQEAYGQAVKEFVARTV